MFFKEAPAGSFGRVCRHDRHNLEPLDHLANIRRLAARGFQALETIGERARLWAVRRVQSVVAPAADPMMLFGDVHELEIDRERADDAVHFVDIETAQERQELFLTGRIGLRSKRFAERAHFFFDPKELAAAMPLQRRAEKASQHLYICPKPLVLFSFSARFVRHVSIMR